MRPRVFQLLVKSSFNDKHFSIKRGSHPGWCGAMGWVLAYGPKGLIPRQSTSLGCRPGSQLGAHKRQLIHVSPLLSPSLPLSLKMSKIFKKKNVVLSYWIWSITTNDFIAGAHTHVHSTCSMSLLTENIFICKKHTQASNFNVSFPNLKSVRSRLLIQLCKKA